jgi:DNA replication protein DnaC
LAASINAHKLCFRVLTRVNLLIIDDFGLKPLHTPHDEDFDDLICEHYVQATTVVTAYLVFGKRGDASYNRLLRSDTSREDNKILPQSREI